jgi:hypothetical protein
MRADLLKRDRYRSYPYGFLFGALTVFSAFIWGAVAPAERRRSLNARRYAFSRMIAYSAGRSLATAAIAVR